MKKLLTKLLSILIIITLAFGDYSPASAASTLSAKQRKVANYIAEVAAENWDTYGVLPSVAVAQAFIESSLGEHCPNYNLWGIGSGKYYYGSLKEGVIGYLKVINNGYYKGAPFSTDYSTQLRKILDGGYCQPEGEYYKNALWAIETYNFDQYDEDMFKAQEEAKQKAIALKKAKAKAKKEAAKKKKVESMKFKAVYSSAVEANEVWINSSLVSKGTILLWDSAKHYNMYGIYDLNSMKGIRKDVVYVPDETLDGQTIYIQIDTTAKG